mmetsp:Transcript_127080/g.359680  ORF Transcript_127080/g.359680 Transcript_127080/m.359680 type:complete len:205 (+) Transcript_127080:392-1006(+)
MGSASWEHLPRAAAGGSSQDCGTSWPLALLRLLRPPPPLAPAPPSTLLVVRPEESVRSIRTVPSARLTFVIFTSQELPPPSAKSANGSRPPKKVSKRLVASPRVKRRGTKPPLTAPWPPLAGGPWGGRPGGCSKQPPNQPPPAVDGVGGGRCLWKGSPGPSPGARPHHWKLSDAPAADDAECCGGGASRTWSYLARLSLSLSVA